MDCPLACSRLVGKHVLGGCPILLFFASCCSSSWNWHSNFERSVSGLHSNFAAMMWYIAVDTHADLAVCDIFWQWRYSDDFPLSIVIIATDDDDHDHYIPLPWLWGNENYHDIDCGLAVLWKNMKACDGANGKWELIPENQPVPSWIRGQRPLWLLTNERWDSITEQWDQGSNGLAQGPNQLKTSNKLNVLKHAGKSPRISKEMFETSLHLFLVVLNHHLTPAEW
jgi:hypothetical protein